MTNVTIQQSNANAEANARLRNNSQNKPLYIIVVNSPKKIYAAINHENTPYGVSLKGFEMKSQKEVQNYNDALDHANKEETKMVNTLIPWHRVVEIQNTTYVYRREVKK